MSEPLPSQSSADALVTGDLAALPYVLAHTFGRALIIAVGLFLAGLVKVRNPWARLALTAIAGALAIEAFVLGWAFTHRES